MVVLSLITIDGGGWREAVKLISGQRQQTAASSDDMLPAYRHAIRKCGGAGRWRTALQLLRQLETDGGPTDTGCYAEAMKACRKNGAWSIALTLLEELRVKGMEPEVYTTSNAIAACEPGGLWQRAVALLRAQDDPNVIYYNSALSVCAAAARKNEMAAWR